MQYTMNIPESDPLYETYGHYENIEKIIGSKVFSPVYIAGPTGIGKTKGVVEACARTKRMMVRFNPTFETDRDTLIGGFRLKNGETYFEDGPVVAAMRAGAVLLIDEIDLASPEKIMCLQSILEGSSYTIPETKELIKPAPGFNIVATANTKGRGSQGGLYIGTQIHNEAFLERFVTTINHGYPSADQEIKILTKLDKERGTNLGADMIKHLVAWAQKTRALYAEGGNMVVITPRRLCHIVNLVKIVGNSELAIELAINRFEDHEIKALISLMEKMRPNRVQGTAAVQWDFDENLDEVYLVDSEGTRHSLKPF